MNISPFLLNTVDFPRKIIYRKNIKENQNNTDSTLKIILKISLKLSVISNKLYRNSNFKIQTLNLSINWALLSNNDTALLIYSQVENNIQLKAGLKILRPGAINPVEAPLTENCGVRKGGVISKNGITNKCSI